MNKKLIPFLILLVIFSCFGKQEGLKESEMIPLMNRFLSMHVQYKDFNNELSERTLSNYIMILDYGKYYFYKSDINDFDKHKDMLDDYVKAGNYKVIIDIYDVYKKRFSEAMVIVDSLLEARHDFTVDEEITTDRDLIDYVSNADEMKERWRKNIKLQLLNYMSTGKNMEYARNKLKKKYELLRKQNSETDRSDIFVKFVNAWALALDPHSYYLTQDENDDFHISMELKLEGIGVRLKSEDGFVLVDSIITGGASDKLPEKLKLKPNDKIVAVSQDNDDWTDVIDMELKDVVKLIRGKKGTNVYLTIVRDAGENGKTDRMTVPIKREEIKLQDSEAKYDVQTSGSGNDTVKIGYINLPSFYMDANGSKSSSGDIRKILFNLSNKNINALILDLRGNPGGLLNEAVEIAGLFINGPVVQIKDSNHSPVVYNNNEPGIVYEGPLVILIDRFSASAAEIIAGVIKDYRRGLIVGSSNTFGKGTVQSYNELGGKRGAMKVTTHIFYQPSGTSNQLNGITPDVIIPDINSVWDIGENKAKYPLKWLPIPMARFNFVNMVSPEIAAALQSLSKRRISSDKDFKALQTKMDTLKKQINKKSISLKEESSIERQKENEFEKSLNKGNKKIIDLENDLFLREAFNVTRDYIRITR